MNRFKKMKQIHKFLGISIAIIFTLCLPLNGFSQETSEKAINNEYEHIIKEYIHKDIQHRQAVMKKTAERTLVNLPNEEKIYDETYIDVKAKVAEGKTEEGNNELNFVYDMSYNCKHIESINDDYPTGEYAWNSSKSCKAICNLTKQLLETKCSDLIKPGKKVTIKIYASTDAREISHINYGGEYGDFRYCAATYNNEPVRISVSKAEGISTNAQLAFIRAQSIKSYLEKNLTLLKGTQTEYEIITKSFNHEGSFYRRSSIEIIVHDAFKETIHDMNEKLNNDEYIDFNIPTTEPNSNKETFVVIVANEDYNTPFPSVQYAHNDGTIFAEYCIKTLGLPERHVKILNNAGRQEIKDLGIDWLKDMTVALEGNAKVIIYMAGLAIADANYNPYFVPNGININEIRGLQNKINTTIPLKHNETNKFLNQCLSLDTLCSWFNRVDNKGITILIDASFDGTNRDGEPFLNIEKETERMRGMRIRNDIVIFSASNFNKPAYNFDAQQHGFFTYFLLKELKHSKGDLDYGQLIERVRGQLSYESSLQGKLQEPAISVGGKIKDTWNTIRLK